MAGREGKQQQLEAQAEQRRISKEELLRPELFEKEVEISSMGGKTVLIKAMSHRDRVRIRESCGFGTDDFDESKFTLLSIIESIVDPKISEDDLEALAAQDASVIDELVVQISVLNMLGRTDDLKKDSDATPNFDSA